MYFAGEFIPYEIPACRQAGWTLKQHMIKKLVIKFSPRLARYAVGQGDPALGGMLSGFRTGFICR